MVKLPSDGVIETLNLRERQSEGERVIANRKKIDGLIHSNLIFQERDELVCLLI